MEASHSHHHQHNDDIDELSALESVMSHSDHDESCDSHKIMEAIFDKDTIEYKLQKNRAIDRPFQLKMTQEFEKMHFSML